ncbi:hypothetical protein AGMMS49573_10930 [Endomicrobiia bacterium]|nr:hypothetical protein AGMMS49573_10930 [Endomicrobiia bacterium]
MKKLKAIIHSDKCQLFFSYDNTKEIEKFSFVDGTYSVQFNEETNSIIDFEFTGIKADANFLQHLIMKNENLNRFGYVGGLYNIWNKYYTEKQARLTIARFLAKPSIKNISEVLNCIEEFGTGCSNTKLRDIVIYKKYEKLQTSKKFDDLLIAKTYKAYPWMLDVLADLVQNKSSYFYYLYGMSDGGKSLFIKLVTAIIGHEYTETQNMKDLKTNAATSLYNLDKTLLIVNADTDESDRISKDFVGLINSLVSDGDSLKTSNSPFFTFCTFNFSLKGNVSILL